MKKCQTSMQVMEVMATVAIRRPHHHLLPIRIRTKDQVAVDKGEKDIIKQLPPSSRELLLKYIFEQKTHKELRTDLGYKNNEVLYTKLSTAKARLRKEIEASPNHKTLNEIITLLGYGHR